MTIFKLILGIVLLITGAISIGMGLVPGLDSIEAHFCYCEGLLTVILGNSIVEKA